MSGKFSMDDYVDVAERIAEFDKRYPEGSLQTIKWSVEDIGGQTFIVYHAAAYRTPDDPRPGMGIAAEPFPGRTTYTKNSELMNAETSAWGRAIVACGLSSRKIASVQEVRARQPDSDSNGNGAPVVAAPVDRYAEAAAAHARLPQPVATLPKPSERPAEADQRKALRDKAAAAGLAPSEFADVIKQAIGMELGEWANEDAATRWLKRNLDRLPAKHVDAVVEGIERL